MASEKAERVAIRGWAGRAAGMARVAGERFLDALYPRVCPICRRMEVGSPRDLCVACRRVLPVLRAPFCECCSQPFPGEMTAPFTCDNCGGRRFHFEHAVAAYRCRGTVRRLIHRFKYDGHHYLRGVLAGWMWDGLSDPRLAGWGWDALVPVPLHRLRERERGYNQAAEIGARVARACGKPMLRLLERVRPTETQTHFDRQERMENLRGAFALRQYFAMNGTRILLVDDVFTTGSTVEECSRVLRRAGAGSIRVLTVARG